jgi:hypothetical protein
MSPVLILPKSPPLRTIFLRDLWLIHLLNFADNLSGAVLFLFRYNIIQTANYFDKLWRGGASGRAFPPGGNEKKREKKPRLLEGAGLF